MSSVTEKETQDRLLLSLSHAPLPMPLLETLLEQTSSECKSMLKSIDEIREKMIQYDQDEKKEVQTQTVSKRNTILHVLATGTPYVTKPGKSQPDYIHQWTKGELILARLVDKIGMEKFHRVPKDGETKLAGRLIDVKPSDFEFILNHRIENEAPDEENKPWSDDCLMEELTWIANNILRILIIDHRPKIGIAKVLFPLDPRFEHVKENELLRFIDSIFQKEWSDTDGPLHGANIEIIIVKEEP